MTRERQLDELLKVVQSSGGFQVFAAPAEAATDWLTTSLSAGLRLAVANQLSNSELVGVRESVSAAWSSLDRVEVMAAENALLAGQLDAMLAVLETDAADDTNIPSMFAFLPEGSTFAVLKDGQPLYSNGIDEHSLRIEARRMSSQVEHRCDIGSGERFVYRSDPYVAIVDSKQQLDQIRRRLIRLSLAQLATHQQERRHHELLERVRNLIGSESVADGETLRSPEAASSVENDVARLIEATFTDSLTRVYNRSKTTAVMKSLMDEPRNFSIVMADIDHFKAVNDNHGHLVGDRVIVAVAGCLDGDRRPDDVVARWGGEEFIAVLPDLDASQARGKAERWRQAVRDTVHVGEAPVTCSFGVAQWSADDDMEQLMARVDDALYRAKRNGRNRVEIDHLDGLPSLPSAS